jgi:hypothetical protein
MRLRVVPGQNDFQVCRDRQIILSATACTPLQLTANIFNWAPGWLFPPRIHESRTVRDTLDAAPRRLPEAAAVTWANSIAVGADNGSYKYYVKPGEVMPGPW